MQLRSERSQTSDRSAPARVRLWVTIWVAASLGLSSSAILAQSETLAATSGSGPEAVSGSSSLPREAATSPRVVANVVSVSAEGEEGAYRFTVGIESPDLGCQQYANWWEVVSEDGHLLYRRILAHSHVNEQPFVRSGGPVAIDPDAVILVRAYMHPSGYGGRAFRGSVATGFAPTELADSFADELAERQPLPKDCAN